MKPTPGYLNAFAAAKRIGCSSECIRKNLKRSRIVGAKSGLYEYPIAKIDMLKLKMRAYGWRWKKLAPDKPDEGVVATAPKRRATAMASGTDVEAAVRKAPSTSMPEIRDLESARSFLQWLVDGRDKGLISDRGAIEIIRRAIEK